MLLVSGFTVIVRHCVTWLHVTETMSPLSRNNGPKMRSFLFELASAPAGMHQSFYMSWGQRAVATHVFNPLRNILSKVDLLNKTDNKKLLALTLISTISTHQPPHRKVKTVNWL